MRRRILSPSCFLIAAIFALVAVSQGNSSKLVFTWRNSNYQGGGFKNILVLAINGSAAARADFEDRMVKEISRPGITVVQSYTLMPRPDATPINTNDLRGYVRDLKFDSIVVSRIVKFDKKQVEVQGDDFPFYPYYGTFYGYYDVVAPIVYDPGYLKTETEAQVETNFYSTAKPDGVLVWSATTDTVDPHSETSAVDGIVKVLVNRLEKDKLI
jgi:hypothetical protein